jgi:hypothetical protein
MSDTESSDEEWIPGSEDYSSSETETEDDERDMEILKLRIKNETLKEQVKDLTKKIKIILSHFSLNGELVDKFCKSICEKGGDEIQRSVEESEVESGVCEE